MLLLKANSYPSSYTTGTEARLELTYKQHLKSGFSTPLQRDPVVKQTMLVRA